MNVLNGILVIVKALERNCVVIYCTPKSNRFDDVVGEKFPLPVFKDANKLQTVSGIIISKFRKMCVSVVFIHV